MATEEEVSPAPFMTDGQPHIYYVAPDGTQACLDMVDPKHLRASQRDLVVLDTLLRYAANLVAQEYSMRAHGLAGHPHADGV